MENKKDDEIYEIDDPDEFDPTETLTNAVLIAEQAVRMDEPEQRAAPPAPTFATTAKRNTPSVAEILEGTLNPNRPRAGGNIFLMMDINAIKTRQGETKIVTTTRNNVVNEIELLNRSSDFHVSIDANGWLTVIANSERATAILGRTMMAINTTWPAARVIMNSGTTTHTEEKDYTLNGRPTAEQLPTAPGMYFLHDLDIKTDDPDSRESSLVRIIKGELPENGLRKIIKIEAKPEEIGGPDKFIGNEEKLAKLKTDLRDPSRHLITVEGVRGIGKSRMIQEALADYPGLQIPCSIDASDRKNPGAGLVSLAQGIVLAKEKNKMKLPLGAIVDFFKQYDTPAKQVEFARSNPAQLAQRCEEALQMILLEDENAVLDLRDLHNIDFFSQVHIRRVLKSAFFQEGSRGKVLTCLRPEDMDIAIPEIQENLEKDSKQAFGNTGHSKITLTNLDPQAINPETQESYGYEYVYYSLPEDFRKGKRLGNWAQTVAEISGGHPFVLNYLIDTLIEGDHLKVADGTVINVDPEVIAELKRSIASSGNPTSDLAIHFSQRLAKLSEPARQVFQGMAVCGGRISNNQLSALIATSGESSRAIMDQLRKGQYILGSEEKGWRLESELTIALANNSLSDQRARESFLEALLYQFRDDPVVATKLRYEMATGPTPPDANSQFWTDFADDVSKKLTRLRTERAYGESFDWTRGLIGKRTVKKEHENEDVAEVAKDSEKINVSGGVIDINNAIEVLKLGTRDVEPSMKKLAASALLATAQNGVYLARFKEAQLAFNELQAILAANPDDNTLLEIATATELNKAAFELAYRSRNIPEMQRLLGKIETDTQISHEEKTLAQIQLAYTESNPQKVNAIYEPAEVNLAAKNTSYKTSHKGEPSPKISEIERLKFLSDYRAFRMKIERNGKLDEDVDFRPEVVQTVIYEDRTRLHKTVTEMLQLNEDYPTHYDPNSISNLLCIDAELEIYEGHYRQAVEKLNHAWQFANRMEVNDTAVRAAKKLADLYITCGMPEEALEVYGRLGKTSMSTLDESNFSKWAMRAQQIRYTSILARSENFTSKMQEKEQTQLRSKLRPYVEEAFENYRILNELSKTVPDINSDKVSYYLGHMGIVLWIASKLELTIPANIFDEEAYPLSSADYLLSGTAQTEKMIDFGLGGTVRVKGVKLVGESEITLKRKGLDLMQRASTGWRARQAARIAAEEPPQA